MTDGVGSENYTYNNLEQLTQLQKVINGTTYTTSYLFNLAGESTQITYPSGRVVQQSVDAIGRLCAVGASGSTCTSGTTYATGYGYSAAGAVTGFKYGNGIYASFGFSPDRLQLNCLDYSTTNRGTSCTHDGTTKFGLSYSYSAAGSNNGQISGITDSVDSGRNATYTYDSLYRLYTAVTAGSTNYPAWGLKEIYDRYGNRSAQNVYSGCSGITCPTNSVTVSATTNQITGSPYAYDLGGNMTNDGGNTLTYDAENHVVSSSGSLGSGTYTYDGKGLRVQKCLPSCGGSNAYTVYIFSGAKVIAEYDNGAAVGSPSREYIYSGATLLAKIDFSGTKYYHQDHLSNRYVTDSSSNKVAEMGHFPYGEKWYNAANDKLLFTTYERDSESGNDYAQARYNVNRLGRFSSPDPIAGSTSDPQSLNRYSYVRNMPVMLSDPSGMVSNCNTVKNSTDDQSASSDSDGVGLLPNEEMDPPPPQSGCPGSHTPPSGGGIFGDGSLPLDGGYVGDDSGMGIGSPIGGGDLASRIALMNVLVSSSYSWGISSWELICGLPGGCNEIPNYGWIVGGAIGIGVFFGDPGDPGGGDDSWSSVRKDLILKVTRDCFNKAAGQREVTYQLATQSGTPLEGTYNITEQQSDTSVTPPNPWGQSSNDPSTDGNNFYDTLRPALLSSQTVKSTQYFLVSPGGLGIAQWVPISRPGQALSMFNTIVMQGPLSSNPNTVKINGHAAPLCGFI